ncbi:MAG: hypothetical protein IKU37_03515 [Candidatus Gastranaerophilales bacterium]|nr:hypothetical protein [Candidatus Gastranaerophilales bacterium]
MRILPLLNLNRSFVNSNKGAFNKVEDSQNKLQAHKYTGVASVDLAYASMFDNEIARDLKLMGLI